MKKEAPRKPESPSTEGVQFVFHGIVERRDTQYLSLRLFPGFVLDIRTDDIAEIQEVTDQVTQKAYVRVKLKPEAEIRANFKPRLARLALTAEGRVPFALGGTSGEGPGHGLPSGGAPSIVPLSDPSGLSAFARMMPPQAWALLAQALSQTRMAGDTKPTTQDTPNQTSERTEQNTPYQTPYETSNSTYERTVFEGAAKLDEEKDTRIDQRADEADDSMTDTRVDKYDDTIEDPKGW